MGKVLSQGPHQEMMNTVVQSAFRINIASTILNLIQLESFWNVNPELIIHRITSSGKFLCGHNSSQLNESR